MLLLNAAASYRKSLASESTFGKRDRMSDSKKNTTSSDDGLCHSMISAADRLEVLISALKAVPEELAAKMNLECDAVMVNQTECESDRLFWLEDKNAKGMHHESSHDTQYESSHDTQYESSHDTQRDTQYESSHDTQRDTQYESSHDTQHCQNRHMIHCIEMKERGVGLSRNTCIDNIDPDKKIVLFADDDIRYGKGYAKKIMDEFTAHPEADMILFNVNVCEERATYHNEAWKRVRSYNSGRYPAYSIAVKTDKLLKSGVRFSLLFGGGARFSCGEDSLFFRECLKMGIRIYASPILIAGEEVRTSTWFCGYNEKYFTDKGVLYYYMYGHMAGIAARYYLMRHKDAWCKVIGTDKAMKLLKEGIALGRRVKAEELAGTTEEQAAGAGGQGDGV